jgi:hypothetical protein
MNVKNYEHLTHPKRQIIQHDKIKSEEFNMHIQKEKRVMRRKEVGERKLVGVGVVFQHFSLQSYKTSCMVFYNSQHSTLFLGVLNVRL